MIANSVVIKNADTASTTFVWKLHAKHTISITDIIAVANSNNYLL